MRQGESLPDRNTRKRDHAPRGVFRPRKDVWAVRFACGCGRIHEESIGSLKGDAVRAYYARKVKVREGWCPRQQQRRTVMVLEDYARDFIQWAKQHHRSWAKDDSRLSRVLPVL